MKNTFFPIIFLVLLGSQVSAQKQQFKRLEIGDTIPELQLEYSSDGKKQSINTREWRGKLIILDFWNIWCTSCIAAMPEMSRLQQRFPASLRLFPVTNNSQKQIDKQFQKIAKRSGGEQNHTGVPDNLASIVGDTVLHQLFPHRSVPHHVWIDQDGKVKYISDGQNSTTENVESFLQHKEIKLTLKKDTGTFDMQAPLYREGGGRQLSNLQYYSMIYREAGEWSNRNIVQQHDTANFVYRFRMINSTLLELARQTTITKYKTKFFAKNRLVLDVADSSKFYWPKDKNEKSAWREKNLYCYDLAAPLSRAEERNYIMLSDLNQLLPYSFAIEIRKVKCLALVKSKKTRIIPSTQRNTPKAYYTEGGEFIMENGTIDDLITQGLSALNAGIETPIEDATGYGRRLDIRLTEVKNLNQIKKELNMHGFDLVEKEMNAEMLVIADHE